MIITPKPLALDAPELKRPGVGLQVWQRQKFMCQPGLASHCDHYRRFTMADSLTTIETWLKDCQSKRQRAWLGWGQHSGPSKWGPWLPAAMQTEQYGVWEQTPGTENERRFYLNLNLATVREWFEQQLDALDTLLAKYPNVYALEMLIAGQHGEGYYPWDFKQTAALPTPDTQRWMVDTFHKRFAARYRLLTPYREDVRTFHGLTKGWSWSMMSFGNADQFKKLDRGMGHATYGQLVRDAWKVGPCRGETFGSFGTSYPFTTIEQQVPAYHLATLGDGNFIGTYSTSPWNHWQSCQPNSTTKWTDTEIGAWVRSGKSAGWRHRLQQIELGELRAGETTTIATTIANDGSTPGYDPWGLRWQLEDANGLVLDVPSTIDFRQGLPGESNAVVVETIQLPIAPGPYRLIAALPPYGAQALGYSMPLAHQDGLLPDGRYLLSEIMIAPAERVVDRVAVRAKIAEIQSGLTELAALVGDEG